jgi:lipoate-protein ligase A
MIYYKAKKEINPMINNLNEQKAKVKERLNKEIDDYFEKLERSSLQEDFDINKFERLMVENQANVKASLNEANSELASNVDTSEKKTAHDAETP